jgi:protein involved in polysaccharide export with SLBB domain|tara:strand:+ start:577 stop:2163 length:1587 start_codon:yes stop_codon:yes gene_type:complete
MVSAKERRTIIKHIYLKNLAVYIITGTTLLFGFNNKSFGNTSSFKQVSSTIPIKSVDILASSLNPDSLFVGPGDIMDIDIVSSTIVSNYDLMIDNTGSIVIPIVGEIKIDGFSLTEAQNEIIKKIKEHYDYANITVLLKKAGLFKIKIIGPFNHSVFYTATSFMTVHDIYQIFIAELKNTQKNINKISNRHIQLNRDNKQINVDLLLFNLTGDLSESPFLRRGDVLKIGYIELYSSIWGGVNRPQTYEYVPGETILELMNLAGGTTSRADKEKIDVTSFINGEKITNHYSIIELANILVKPDDIVLVHEDNYKNRQTIVNINGEIKFPGPYQVEFGVTNIIDLIKKAGGFTQFADSTRIVLSNTNMQSIQLSPIEKPKAFTTSADLSWALEVWENSTNQYTVSLRVDQFPGYKFNPGDEVNILPFLNYIDVVGAINSPGRLSFSENNSAKFYINQCGGKSSNSTRNLYVIKSGTHNRCPIGNNTIIERGDVIFVPENIEYNKWERFKDWMTVTSQIGTLILILQNIIN